VKRVELTELDRDWAGVLHAVRRRTRAGRLAAYAVLMLT
jgi:hypothetical protein